MKNLMFVLFLYILSPKSEIPKSYLKKIDKEVFGLFDITSYEKQLVEIDKEVLVQMSPDFDPVGFFSIEVNDERLGYFYYGTALSKADEFDYVVIFDRELIIKKVKILAYREDYGGEISSKRWLRQFDGKSSGDVLKLGAEIKGISGATISALSMTTAVNSLLNNVSKLSK